MRLAMLVALLLAGCSTSLGMPRCVNPQPAGADCAYGLSSVSSTALFFDDRNAMRAADGIRAAGFDVETQADHRVASSREYRAENRSLAASRAANGTFELVFEVVAQTGLGLTSAEANALGEELQREHDARAAEVLLAFENATGWRADTERAWTSLIYVT